MNLSLRLFQLFLLFIGTYAFASSSSFGSLSVSELKRLLSERGVDFRDCLEKKDLVERLEAAKHLGSTSTATAKNQLSSEETKRISTFQRVSPAVAFITTIVRATRRFSLQEMEVPMGTGSGFLWDDKGHVVTNYHVVAAQGGPEGLPKQFKVKLAGMAEASVATVIGVEPEKDLAVLKIDVPRTNLPKPLDVGTSSDLQVGQAVLAIGNPFGLDNTLTTGVVSATGRDVQGIGGRPIKGCIQTDAAINPGNSGGPLLDSNGKLIGVNTAIYTGGTSRGNVGIGFAIPVDTVRRVVNQIIRYGKVVRPTLGIQVVDDRVVQSISQQLRRNLQGVLIAEVLPNSPASSLLQPTTMNGDGTLNLGDLITHIDGEPVKQVEDLLSEVEKKREGDSVRLTVLRNGVKGMYVTVKLTSRDNLSSSRNSRASQSPQQFTRSWQ